MTGQDISRLFDTRIDEDYSDFASDLGAKQRLFDDAFIKVVEDRYKGIGSSQKELDEIAQVIVSGREIEIANNSFRVRPFAITALAYNGTIVTFTFNQIHDVVVGQSFTVAQATGVTGANATYVATGVTGANATYVATAVTGTAITAADPGLTGTYNTGSGYVTHAKMIENYMHLLSIKCRGVNRLPGITISTISTTADPTISFNGLTDFRDGDFVRLTGALGVAGIPTIGFYVKRLNRYRYLMYSDPYLNNLLTLSGTYQGGGVAKRISYRSATYYMPDRDISDLSKPNASVPGVRLSENYMKVLPDGIEFDAVKIDYVKVPDVRILLTDNTTRLENYYTERFLGRVVDEAIKAFDQAARDLQQLTVTDANIQKNNP